LDTTSKTTPGISQDSIGVRVGNYFDIRATGPVGVVVGAIMAIVIFAMIATVIVVAR
jgi:hypothetical protein